VSRQRGRPAGGPDMSALQGAPDRDFSCSRPFQRHRCSRGEGGRCGRGGCAVKWPCKPSWQADLHDTTRRWSRSTRIAGWSLAADVVGRAAHRQCGGPGFGRGTPGWQQTSKRRRCGNKIGPAGRNHVQWAGYSPVGIHSNPHSCLWSGAALGVFRLANRKGGLGKVSFARMFAHAIGFAQSSHGLDVP